MNMTDAAIGSIAFYYSTSAAVTGGVTIWSGLNGTRTLLGSINLIANDSLQKCATDAQQQLPWFGRRSQPARQGI